jgi:hypothetical protein
MHATMCVHEKWSENEPKTKNNYVTGRGAIIASAPHEYISNTGYF